MLAHVFSAFVKLRLVNSDGLFFFNALTERLCELYVCVRACVSVPCVCVCVSV